MKHFLPIPKFRLQVLNFKFQALCAFLCASCFMIQASSVHAQQVTLTVSPPIVSVIVKPGKTMLIAYDLRNGGDPVIILPHVLPFVPSLRTGEMLFKNKPGGPIEFSLQNTDHALNKSFFFDSNKHVQLLLQITVPETTPEGDYYYTFLNQTQTAGEQQATGPTASAAIGSTLLITVSESGATSADAHISTFTVKPRYRLNLFGHIINIIESNDKVPVLLNVFNNGKNAITTSGTLALQGNFGERAHYDLSPMMILAHSGRDIVASDSANTIKAAATLKGFFIGSYGLSAQVLVNEDAQTLLATTKFYAFPIRLTIAMLIVLAIASFIISRIKEQDR